MKAINYKTIAILSLLVFVFLLGFNFSVQAYRISRQELNNPVSRYLRENYGVNSIEEYRAKLEQEAWINISRQMEALASQYPEINFSQWRSSDVYRQYGTASYQPPKITPQQPFYIAIFSEPVTVLQIFSLSGLGLIGLAAVPPIRKSKHLKQALVLGVVVLCVFSVGYFVGLTVAQTETITIEPGSFQTEASYIIFTDGTTVYARNGKTGAIDFRGTSAGAVIQQAINALGSVGGKIAIKAGTYDVGSTQLSSTAPVIIYGEGRATVITSSALDTVIDETNITLWHLQYKKNGSLTFATATATFQYQYQMGASYIISTDGTNVYARNGQTGAIDYNGTDAASVIQSALNALGTVGGKIFIKAGTYLITKSISVPANTEIEGEGWATELKIPDGFNANIKVLYINGDNVVIKNIKLNGNREAQTTGLIVGVQVASGYKNLHVENCLFQSFMLNAIGAIGYYHSIINNVFTDIGSIAVTTGAYYILIEGNMFYSNLGSAIWAGGYYNSIVGNQIIDGASDGIVVDGSRFALISGNYLNGNAGRGMFFGTYGEAVIVGNEIRNSGQHGIFIEGYGNYAIVGNVFYGNKWDGLRIWKSSYNTVVGNTFHDNGQASNNVYNDIFLTDDGTTFSTNNIIMGNTIIATATNKTAYGIRENAPGDDYNLILENIISGPVTANISIRGPHSHVKGNIGYDTENFKVTGLSVAIGTGGAYGNASTITTLSGTVTYPRVKITWGGTFGTGETVTVKVEAVYTDGTTAYVEKSATATGSLWLTDDDVLSLITQGKDIVKLNVYAKTNLSSTTVTVTVDAYGKA